MSQSLRVELLTIRRPKVIPFELKHDPWFGPHRRAKECLEKRKFIVPANVFAGTLADLLACSTDDLLHITFYDYCDGNAYRYTIALVFTRSDYRLRRLVYERATEIVEKTGWYPLVQGERLSSKKNQFVFGDHLYGEPNREYSFKGGLIGVSSAAEPNNGGCSVRVHLTDGTLLLDLGLPPGPPLLDTDKLAILSHFHRDHCGQLLNEESKSIRVFTSQMTLSLLTQIGILQPAIVLERLRILRNSVPVNLGREVSLEIFPVPHCPGSSGVQISDTRSTLIYTGDISLGSHRHNYIDELSRRLRRCRTAKKMLLLDSTMLGRPYGASTNRPAYGLLEHCGRFSDIAVVAQDLEQLLYAYLDLYYEIRSREGLYRQAAFLVPIELRPMFTYLHRAFIERDIAELDPFILSQYGKEFLAWGESSFLYWVDGSEPKDSLPQDKLRFWFVTPRHAGLILRDRELAHVIVGREVNWLAEDSIPGSRLDVDTTSWSLHSSAEVLQMTIEHFAQHCTVVLFHNYPKRIQQFISRQGLKAYALSDELMHIQ